MNALSWIRKSRQYQPVLKVKYPIQQSGPFHEERRFLISEKRPIVEKHYLEFM
ncbi:hypothetical protein V7127_01310 [Bacillus sp. JJ1773]|uniref:hypothetical protein n=1 Tax=Bacillus sp. JJ1773 TaxID=3122965 RepID=UPI0030006185